MGRDWSDWGRPGSGWELKCAKACNQVRVRATAQEDSEECTHKDEYSESVAWREARANEALKDLEYDDDVPEECCPWCSA